MSIITSMDHLLASPFGMYQPYLIHTLSIKVSTRFHQLSKTRLGLSVFKQNSGTVVSNEEVINYKVVNLIEIYNFYIKFVFI
jgi:hypothetical protein